MFSEKSKNLNYISLYISPIPDFLIYYTYLTPLSNTTLRLNSTIRILQKLIIFCNYDFRHLGIL